ncbi:Thiamine pyrophosphate enzyme, TPP binding domain-containing protein [Cladophialophora immunda]|nr:Thiamine pyrophosphate enzyme, TPP binding domain-containing protein [Cladophialophora immunda]
MVSCETEGVIYTKIGYAADGYARVKGISAIVTTGGVGELSAINPHAGAYSEQVAMVHIVGSPALSIRGNTKFSMHHTLSNGDYDVFKNMFKTVSADQVTLNDASRAPEQIDQILKTCWISNRPVYVDVPADMANKVVDGSRLSTPLDLSYPVSDRNQEAKALVALASKLSSAKRPCILVDMGAARERIDDAMHNLVVKSGLPTFVTPLAQGFVNETLPNFGGLYAGAGSHLGVQEFVEQSDFVLHIGPLDTDVTTYLGSANINQKAVIKLFTAQVQLDEKTYSPVHLHLFIPAMVEKLNFSTLAIQPFRPSRCYETVATQDAGPITQAWLWTYISNWLRRGDIVLTDTGTASFGIFDTKLPPDSMLISISLWASIGYSLPSAQGAALAAKDAGSERRTVLFQGDGSFQLTCQEISTMIKHRLQVFIFVICNNGYAMRGQSTKRPRTITTS